MKATINGITYEGTEDEIRRIVENPPQPPAIRITNVGWPAGDYQRNWDGSSRVTCSTNKEAR